QAEQLKLQQQQRQYDQQQIKMQQDQLQQQQQYLQQQYQAQQSQQAVMTLTQAKNDFLTADSDLNNRWQQLSSESRKALLLSQRQWIKNKDLICGKVTSQGTEAELAKIYACHAETIRSRIPELN
ncbi:lysozyme inhibitor LprI family protein, partial [Proteus mirabilis]